MKYSFAIAALAVAVQAQSLGDVPKCAIPCLDKAIESETSCETTDLACVCKNFSDVRGAATSCVIDKCGSDVAINEVLPATEKLCKNPPKESAAEEKTTEAAAATTEEAVKTTMVVTSSIVTSVAPVVETTSAVVPPVISTPAATPSSEEGAGGATSTPGAAPTEVGQNGAAGLKSIGAVAMAALAALAL